MQPLLDATLGRSLMPSVDRPGNEVDGAKVGDTLYLAYSGHGSQMTDTTGTEPNGMSDCICPLDCDKPWPEHIILDTEIHKHVYDQLPDGVRLCCWVSVLSVSGRGAMIGPKRWVFSSGGVGLCVCVCVCVPWCWTTDRVESSVPLSQAAASPHGKRP